MHGVQHRRRLSGFNDQPMNVGGNTRSHSARLSEVGSPMMTPKGRLLDRGSIQVEIPALGSLKPLNRMARENSLISLTDEIPTPDEIRYEGEVELRVTHLTESWQKRKIVITDTHLIVAKVGGYLVRDQVPLIEITSIRRSDSAHHTLAPAREESIPEAAAAQTSMSPWSRAMSTLSKKKSPGLGPSLKNAKSLKATSLDTQKPGAPLSEFGNTFEVLAPNYGRRLLCKVASGAESAAWVERIESFRVQALERHNKTFSIGRVKEVRQRVAQLYYGSATQKLLALVILANFAMTIFESETTPAPGSDREDIVRKLDYTFTAIYCAELCVNIFIHWWQPFLQDGWCLFDLAVVVLSLLAISLGQSLNINTLRVIRILKVLRLFKTLRRLRRIVDALTSAVVPVLNSFIIFFLVSSVYSVVAVNLYGEQLEDLFGKFSLALFTMFQFSTYDNWSIPVRELFSQPGEVNFGAAFFFISYIIIVGTVLLNVVVAVLLDAFLEAMASEEQEHIRVREQAHIEGKSVCLDPLLATLSTFDTVDDLAAEMTMMFRWLDTDDSGELTFSEIKNGLELLKVVPTIRFSMEDYEVLTVGRTLCTPQQTMRLEHFEAGLLRQLHIYAQRRLAATMSEAEVSGTQNASVFLALKVLVAESNWTAKYHSTSGAETNLALKGTVAGGIATPSSSSATGLHNSTSRRMWEGPEFDELMAIRVKSSHAEPPALGAEPMSRSARFLDEVQESAGAAGTVLDRALPRAVSAPAVSPIVDGLGSMGVGGAGFGTYPHAWPAGRGLASFPKRGPETDAPPPIQEEVTEPGSGGSLLDPEQPAAEKVTTQPASGTASDLKSEARAGPVQVERSSAEDVGELKAELQRVWAAVESNGRKLDQVLEALGSLQPPHHFQPPHATQPQTQTQTSQARPQTQTQTQTQTQAQTQTQPFQTQTETETEARPLETQTQTQTQTREKAMQLQTQPPREVEKEQGGERERGSEEGRGRAGSGVRREEGEGERKGEMAGAQRRGGGGGEEEGGGERSGRGEAKERAGEREAGKKEREDAKEGEQAEAKTNKTEEEEERGERGGRGGEEGLLAALSDVNAALEEHESFTHNFRSSAHNFRPPSMDSHNNFRPAPHANFRPSAASSWVHPGVGEREEREDARKREALFAQRQLRDDNGVPQNGDASFGNGELSFGNLLPSPPASRRTRRAREEAGGEGEQQRYSDRVRERDRERDKETFRERERGREGGRERERERACGASVGGRSASALRVREALRPSPSPSPPPADASWEDARVGVMGARSATQQRLGAYTPRKVETVADDTVRGGVLHLSQRSLTPSSVGGRWGSAGIEGQA